MILLLMLASLSWADVNVSSPTVIDASRVEALEQSLAGYTVGRSTFTGTPRMQGGIQCTNTSGNCVVFPDGTGQNTAAGTATSIGTPWLGINYHLWSSSGPVVIFSTGTRVFSVAASSFVYRGVVYSAGQQNFTLINSTYSIITWNPTNGFRQWGTNDFTPPGFSSSTKVNFADDLILGLSSANANGVVSVFETAQKNPNFGIAIANSGTTNTTPTAAAVHRVFDCGASRWFNSCISNAVGFDIQNPHIITLYSPPGTTNVARAWGFVVNNTTGGNLNLSAFGTATANQWWVSVNGAASTSLAASTVTTIAVPSGYSLVMIYHAQQSAGTADGIDVNIPASVNIVRAGFL